MLKPSIRAFKMCVATRKNDFRATKRLGQRLLTTLKPFSLKSNVSQVLSDNKGSIKLMQMSLYFLNKSGTQLTFKRESNVRHLNLMPDLSSA